MQKTSVFLSLPISRIQAALVVPGREKELLSWFTFRVYRELAGGSELLRANNKKRGILQGGLATA
jgi:hypothetical protein